MTRWYKVGGVNTVKRVFFSAVILNFGRVALGHLITTDNLDVVERTTAAFSANFDMLNELRQGTVGN